ncbi:MAG TPA: hypothetical protein VN030_03705 [Cellvibrio sp.]|nr:hypothetical protein [Cellvibrio sp.]
MDTKHLLRVLGYFVSLVMLSGQVVADPFYGSVSALAGVSDNSRKTEHNKKSEEQNQYNLNLGSDWENSLVDFHLGYGAIAKTFSEDSQQERRQLEGGSSLLIGREEQPVSLMLEHSRITLLNSPDSINLTENQDEKDDFSVRPTLRQRLSPVDYLVLNGDFSRINYLESDIKDSQRKGGSLVLDHRFSLLDRLQVYAQQSEIEFKHLPGSDYTYRSAGITYSVKLRKLSYSATVGSNKTIPELGKEYSNPSYTLDLAYDAGGQKIGLNASKVLTDTSANAGNIMVDTDLPVSGSKNTPDQIEKASYGINWSSLAVCNGCTLFAGAKHTRDDYLDQGADAIEQSWSAGMRYALSAATNIAVQFAGSNHKYSSVIIGSAYKLQTSQLEYSYQISRGLSANALLKKEKRYGDERAVSYAEAYAGAGLNYKF